MEPVAAGRLEAPLTRPLVVVGALPFQITRVESSNPRFRCDVPAASPATFHRLPVVFLGGESPGRVDTQIRIHTTASAQPLVASVTIDLTEPLESSAPAASGSLASKPEPYR